MSKRRVKVDIPFRQAEKLIELAESIYRRNRTEPIEDERVDIRRLYEDSVKAKEYRKKSKELTEKGRQAIQEANAMLGISKGQTKETEGTVYSNILMIRDYLKSLYKGQEEKLTAWGYNVEIFNIRGLRKVKILIPVSNADQMISLSETLYKQHLQESGVLKKFDIKSFYNKSQKAKQKRAESRDLSEKADRLIEESNLLLGIGYAQTKDTPGTVYYQMNIILKNLLIKYKESEENLNNWGFKATVVTSVFPIKGGGVTTKKIISVTNQNPLVTLHLIFKGSAGRKIYITWGDGQADKINLIGHTTPNSIYHDYEEEGEYEFQISGDIGKLSYLKINSNQIVSIDIPKNLKNLVHISLKNNMINSHKIINDFFSNLDSAGVFNGELDISGGTNARPSSFGTMAKNNLMSRGWEIITN